MALRVGLGHDTHRLGAPRPLVLGGVAIPHESGLVGHSDADALLHALTDAILGAAGRGDIGERFPDNAAENRNRDSAEMLRIVLEELRPLGMRIHNVDAIVFAEAPKLSPYKRQIAESVATILGVPATCVNVKAKTGEKVGPIGRKEAISAEVVVLAEIADG